MSGRKPPVSVLITTEHASAAVPERWRPLFAGHEAILQTHRAWDPGSRELGRALAEVLDAPLLEGQVTRLLVDLNRSAGHPRLFSEFSRALPASQRHVLMAEYWQPHWQAYAETVTRLPGPVLHLACHSFTPVLDGVVRTADIGLLYDPARPGERRWCQGLRSAIAERLPGLRVRMNYPYRGVSNGLGQQHRRRFRAAQLITMELEVNTALVDGPGWDRIMTGLVAAVSRAAGSRC
ncbi:N-formylglutamate amidohydrolase [Desulfurivibrio alkaliphilus]|uniref:N-formylglutamate amidohydrolase n=1 Tax=Desulfurivibrio alkaliphilus (strain DSM 19089 / UNIQEM U267 / AHT2) TaxID=589865 RepID=D6Z6R5_DESAT|nr:N-formylglutamate amidohydrolase [Desulfurivibrio alkaliphilus]ADH85024.1 N-formylglutamate amidohydrolase [Desulfurivibrio alkaliphilus AHT 2]